MKSLGHETHVIAINWKNGTQTAKLSHVEGVSIHLIENKGYHTRLKRASVGAFHVFLRSLFLRPDIVVIHDPELIPYLVFYRILKVSTIFDAHEDFIAQNSKKSWANGWIRTPVMVISTILLFLAKVFSTHIFAATDGVAKKYPLKKTTVIYNYPKTGDIHAVSLASLKMSKSFSYIGGLSKNRGILQLLEAVSLNNGIDKLYLAGKFENAEFEDLCRSSSGWDKVVYSGYLNRSQISELLSRCRGGIVTLLDTPNHRLSVPVKLLEYYEAGIPVIASNFSEWNAYVIDDITGYLVTPESPSEISNAMDRILDNKNFMRLYNKVAAHKGAFNWRTQELKIKDLLHSMEK